MSRAKDRARKNDDLIAHRERLRAAGQVLVQIPLPRDLVEIVDRMKSERSLMGRGPIVEEALRLLIEKQRA